MLIPPFLFEGDVMDANSMWYGAMFLWGLLSAWAVIDGLRGR